MCTSSRDNTFKDKDLRMENNEKQNLAGLSAEAKTRLDQFIKAYDPINNKAIIRHYGKMGLGMLQRARSGIGVYLFPERLYLRYTRALL